MVLLVTRQGRRMQAAAKRVVAGGSGASGVFGPCFWGVLLGLAMGVIILELLVLVLSQAEQGIWSLSTNMSTMMWQSHCVEQGSVA